ncbi:MAG: hypothetical protein AB8B51_16085 [Sedimentitalea sp.]
MVTVNEYSFRQFQTLYDLKQVALFGQGDHLFQICSLVPGARHSRRDMTAALEHAVAGDGRLLAPIGVDLHPCLQLAAALPAEQLGFQTATAILLRDHLLGGPSVLAENWDVFAPNYRMFSPPVRAAVMQGFALLADLGQMAVDPMPGGEDLVTHPVETVREGLADVAGPLASDASACLAALEGTGPGLSWTRLARMLIRDERPEARLILRAVRHLYESQTRLDPGEPSDGVRQFHLPIPWEMA